MTSTATDDGTPIRCDICGASSLVNVSRPPGDSVCPSCGVFLWVDAVIEVTRRRSFVPGMRLREMSATSRADAVHEITALAAAELGWSAGQHSELSAAVLKREDLGSTAIGKGFAVPHASVDWLAAPVTVMAVSPHGIDFNSPDGRPVHTLVLIASPRSKPSDHVLLMERVSRALRLIGPSTA